MNQELFARTLESLVHLRPNLDEEYRGERFIKLATDEESRNYKREYLSSFRVDRSFTDASISWISVSSNAGRKLMFMGPSLDISSRIDIRASKASEFLFFNDFFENYPIKDANSIIEVLGSGSRADDDYDGHDHVQLSALFNPLYVIDDVDFVQRCCSNILTQHYVGLNHAHGKNYRSPLFDKVTASQWISCELEQAKLLSIAQGHGPLHFLILYWLLESFFFEYSTKQLYLDTKPTINEDEFYRKIASALDWRPKELVAIEKIISKTLPSDTIRALCLNVSTETVLESVTLDNQAEFLARKIYTFRNNLVHARHGREPISNEDLTRFTCALVDIMDAVYRKKNPDGQPQCKCGLSKYHRDSS